MPDENMGGFYTPLCQILEAASQSLVRETQLQWKKGAVSQQLV